MSSVIEVVHWERDERKRERERERERALRLPNADSLATRGAILCVCVCFCLNVCVCMCVCEEGEDRSSTLHRVWLHLVLAVSANHDSCFNWSLAHVQSYYGMIFCGILQTGETFPPPVPSLGLSISPSPSPFVSNSLSLPPRRLDRILTL